MSAFGSKADICSAKGHVRFISESDIKCDIMECPLRANSGQYLTATLDKLLRRGRHSLFQLIENPAPQLRRIAFGDVDFARQRSQCTILRIQQPIEDCTPSIVQGRSQDIYCA